MNIGFVAGVIPRGRIAAFERILWRTLRGNLYMNQSEIPKAIVDPVNDEEVHKNVFVIFAHGKEIISKIRKISESLGADLYSVDENSELRREQIQEVNTRLSDLASVLRNTKNTLDAELTQIAKSLSAWQVVIKKEKAVYQTLNRCSYDQARKTLIAEAWVPTNSLSLIRSTLQDVNDRAGLSIPTIVNQIKTSKTPPTYNVKNKFTEAFQTIIDAYGTAKYTEVNPGLPTIITFPFLFAVMFGDFGHGIIMFCAALAMIYFEKPMSKTKLNELVAMAFYGRYIMMMMGLFSIYTGLIYNDAFSKALTLFPSQWDWPKDFTVGQTVEATLKDNYRYPFGLDWSWHGTDNDLLFSNSYKMKLSILMGWTHVCAATLEPERILTVLDDLLFMPLVDQCATLQIANRHMGKLCTRHGLLPVHLRLPSLHHHLQMVYRLVRNWAIAPRITEHAHLHVSSAGHSRSKGTALSRTNTGTGRTFTHRRGLRTHFASFEAIVPPL